MKILFDCFSCSPYYGSDEGIGWLWPYYMRKNHEVWALVRKDRREDIERYCREYQITDIHFLYADIPDWMNFYYKHKAKGKNKTLDFLAYQYLWQFPAYRAAKKEHKKVHFDLVHHVSTNDFRLLGRLYRLNVPYIIGPIGGAQETPKALQYYVRDHRKSEKLRSLLNRLMTSTPGYRRALNKAKKIYFSNEETREYLLPKITDPSRCEILTEVGWNGELPEQTGKDSGFRTGVCTFLWAGRMEYRKGLELLFDSLDRLNKDLKWQLLLCGDGSEKQYYQQIVQKKSYADRVTFCGKVPYEKMQQYYSQADAFVFPSLRETTGTVIIEAMAHGIPVIALNQGGAKFVITQETGVLVSGNTRGQIVKRFAKQMERFITDPSRSGTLGEAAEERIRSQYTWEAKVQEMEKVYSNLR